MRFRTMGFQDLIAFWHIGRNIPICDPSKKRVAITCLFSFGVKVIEISENEVGYPGRSRERASLCTGLTFLVYVRSAFWIMSGI